MRTWLYRVLIDPIGVAPMAFFRIIIGFLCGLSLLLDWPRLLTFFGQGAFPSIEQEIVIQHPRRFSLLFFLPHSDHAVLAVWALALIFAILLCVGFRTRFSAFALYVFLVSIFHRNIYVLNSGDTLLRIFILLLAFSDAGKAFSLDSWLAGRRTWAQQWQVEAAAWPQRLIQLQLAGVYCQAALTKLPGHTWQNGTAVYYATHLLAYQKFSIPFIFENLLTVKFLTWGSLAIEFALFTLIWFRPWRKYVLWAGVLLHLGIDWCLNIPIFEYLMLAAYICFFDATELKAALNSITCKLPSGLTGFTKLWQRRLKKYS